MQDDFSLDNLHSSGDECADTGAKFTYRLGRYSWETFLMTVPGWAGTMKVSLITWGNLAASSGNRYRINVGSPASNGTDQMLYITEVDTKYGYPVKPVENKFYQLSGKAWRRNGGSGSATFNFYFADDLLATKPVSKKIFDSFGKQCSKYIQ